MKYDKKVAKRLTHEIIETIIKIAPDALGGGNPDMAIAAIYALVTASSGIIASLTRGHPDRASDLIGLIASEMSKTVKLISDRVEAEIGPTSGRVQ